MITNEKLRAIPRPTDDEVALARAVLAREVLCAIRDDHAAEHGETLDPEQCMLVIDDTHVSEWLVVEDLLTDVCDLLEPTEEEGT